MSEYSYSGTELPVFEKAIHWKDYLRGQIRPFVRGAVLEVGAGLGANSTVFRGPGVTSWTCLEPDAGLASQLEERLGPRQGYQVRRGTTLDLGDGAAYDTILYCDVLEHIRDDAGELATAAGLLRDGGALIVVAPAHRLLFSEFDAAIGHLRRYSRNSLAALTPPGLTLRRLRYLDSAGLAASVANRIVLRQSRPDLRQILFWDRVLVRASRVLDPLTFYRLGKSVLAVWTAPAAGL